MGHRPIPRYSTLSPPFFLKRSLGLFYLFRLCLSAFSWIFICFLQCSLCPRPMTCTYKAVNQSDFFSLACHGGKTNGEPQNHCRHVFCCLYPRLRFCDIPCSDPQQTKKISHLSPHVSKLWWGLGEGGGGHSSRRETRHKPAKTWFKQQWPGFGGPVDWGM